MFCEAVGSNTLIIQLIHEDVKPANQVKLSDLLHAIIGDSSRCHRNSLQAKEPVVLWTVEPLLDICDKSV